MLAVSVFDFGCNNPKTKTINHNLDNTGSKCNNKLRQHEQN